MQSDILIVGAGPTGLVLALWLTKMGVKVRILDKTDAPGTTSRALAVHARTLELYRQLDLTDAIIEQGHMVPAVNLWVKGRKEVHVSFADAGQTLTPYPWMHIFPQDQHEKLLVERLQALGVTVERRTELVSFDDTGSGITAILRGPHGEETATARYIAGCDGAHSRVRETIGTGFPGGTYQQLFYVADIEAAGPALDGELHIDLDEADFLAVFPLKGDGRARLIGTVRDERAQHPEMLKFEDVSDRAIQHMKVEVKTVNWFSTYRVHHRVTDHFRKGNAFLLGDAAHIHSPAGGQGMNTGIGDAINLAWKLKWVLDGKASDLMLNSYEQERIAFARKLVATTDKGFSFATADGPIANFVRTRVFPVIFPAVASFHAFREWMFRTVSQTMINYRGDALSEGEAGSVEGGDRLPWLKDAGNYDSLSAITWQVHVYGAARPETEAWSKTNNVPLHVFPWKHDYAHAGLKEGALYLIRPDTYVALAEPSGNPARLTHFFGAHGIKP